MRSSTKKTCAAPLHCGPEKVILFDFFLILFYLVRTRYYFDFLLLSVAEQAGLRLTRSKLQNFDFLPLCIKALSHYNVLANVCRRMKNISSTLAYAEIELKNQRKPLSELIQSVC